MKLLSLVIQWYLMGVVGIGLGILTVEKRRPNKALWALAWPYFAIIGLKEIVSLLIGL